jgi:hypothetical protein
MSIHKWPFLSKINDYIAPCIYACARVICIQAEFLPDFSYKINQAGIIDLK